VQIPSGSEDLKRLHRQLASSTPSRKSATLSVIRDGVLLDGRNRLAACKLANVEPVFMELPDDQDPLDYIDDMDERRNVSKGQRAMVRAIRYPETSKGGRGKKNGSETERFSKRACTTLEQFFIIPALSRSLS
jgi:hypothetical protein